MEEIHTHPAMEKAKQIDSDHVIIDADTFLNVKKLVELSKIEFQDHTLTVEGLIRIIQKLQNIVVKQFRQIHINNILSHLFYTPFIF